MNLAELRRKLAALTDEARALLDKAGKENRSLSDEETKHYDNLLEQAKTLQADIKRYEELEGYTGVTRPEGEERGAPAHHRKPTKDSANALFLRYVRQAAGADDPYLASEYRQAAAEEVRASNDTTMNITTAADGGDLVPVGHYQGIIERARPAALYNRLGLMQIPGTGTTVNVPVDAEADNGAFVSTGESTAFDRDAPAVSKIPMTLVKYTKKVDLTYELMQDEDSRLMDFLNRYVAAGFAATMNALLVAEALADGTAGLTLDSPTAIGAPEIPELLYKLSAEYAEGENVHWLMRRATEGYLRGLASSSIFTFAATPGAAGSGGRGVDNILWGVPSHSNDNMGAMQASGKSLLVGNFSYMAYRLDPTMTFLRDPYSRANYGEVILHYYFRADFEVLQAAALQYATHPTA